MRSVALVVLLLSAGAAGAAWYTRQSDDWQSVSALLDRERERGRQLEAQLQQRHLFAIYCDRQLFGVIMGAQRLVHACRRIESYAALHYPAYLEQIESLGEGRTFREKLAHNLAACFAIRRTEHGGWERDPTLTLRMVAEIAEAVATP